MLKRKSSIHVDSTQIENAEISAMQNISSTKSINDNQRRKETSTNTRRHKTVLVCVICNGDAHGYNFDAISCESCKAFFRRNALRAVGKFKCRGDGNCDVSVKTAKRCKKCRLEKCFQSGMRKEWIMTEKEKEAKRRKIEENRRLRLVHDNHQDRFTIKKTDLNADEDQCFDLFSLINQSYLSDDEWFRSESILNTYTTAVQLNQISGIPKYPQIYPIESTLELLQVPLHISSMRLINFLKQLSEFQDLTTDDQISIVKLNLVTLSFFHSIFLFDPLTNSYHEPNTDDPIYSAEDWNRTFDEQFHKTLRELRENFFQIFSSSDIMRKLTLLILLFSNRISINQSIHRSSSHPDSLLIFTKQNIFIELFYKHFLQIHGTSKTPILFVRYVNQICKLQQLIDQIQCSIDQYVDVALLSPLLSNLFF